MPRPLRHRRAGGGVTDTLQMHWLGDLTAIWHPASQETFSQGVAFQLMFDKLLEREWAADGSSWKPVADLADTWEVSPDGLTWTFHLHPGVKWHDGTAVHGQRRRVHGQPRAPEHRAQHAERLGRRGRRQGEHRSEWRSHRA